MPKYFEDQAEGLRRLMEGPRPNVVSIFSADKKVNHDLNARVIFNIAASLQKEGNKVLVLQAANYKEDLLKKGNPFTTLMDEVTLGIFNETAQYDINECSIKDRKSGFYVSRVFPVGKDLTDYKSDDLFNLSRLIKFLYSRFDVVLIDAALNSNAELPLETISQSNIVVQMGDSLESVTSAYGLIKALSNQTGLKRFGVMVNNCDEYTSSKVFNNISSVISKFTTIELDLIGNVPMDAHQGIAAKVGKSVVDMFPGSIASKSFKSISNKLGSIQKGIANKTGVNLVEYA